MERRQELKEEQRESGGAGGEGAGQKKPKYQSNHTLCHGGF